MSSFQVTAERIRITEHSNADALELAQVGGYRAVVRKGQFEDGQLAVYIPEQAILPDELIDELGLTGKLAGSKRNRLKPVRLRGELSQGIVCLPSAVADVDLAQAEAQRTDLAEALGVTKYVPSVPVHMSGEAHVATDQVRWVDIENVKRYPEVFEDGDWVIGTEKLHGTCCAITFHADPEHPDPLQVSSKGLNSRGLALTGTDKNRQKNLYWRAVDTFELETLARAIAEELDVDTVALFGEVYGAGVQDLTYGQASGQISFALFDVAVVSDGGARTFIAASALPALIAGRVPLAPVLYNGPYDEAKLWELATGEETVSGTGAHLREGLVVRPWRERYAPQLGGRVILKFVSDAYLLRGNATEYE